MISNLGYTLELLEWRGILIHVRYNPDYTGSDVIAHLEIETKEPVHAPLPMTETGYRSHFHPRGTVEEAGGPSAFVLAWLEHEAGRKGWADIEASARQYALF